jgi:serine/threonine protein phosphatase PrpC/predicted Ser/Thr protein kinase
MVTEKELKLSFAGKSSAGVRTQNQDAFAVHHSQDSQVLTHKGVIACLADGVSCSQNGQQASQLCVTQFIQDYLSTADTLSVKQAATQVLSALNAWLHHHSQQSELRHNGFVSTFSGLIFKSNSLHVFHVGDTRIYRLRQGELLQLTRDHCHQGFGDKGMLTRALGMDSHLEIDYQCHEVQLGDLYLLTTDGIHDWLSLADLQAELLQPISLAQSTVKAALNAQAELLVTQALAKGSEDNLSSLLLKVEALPHGDVHSLSTDLLQRVIPPVMTVGNRLDGFEVISVLHSGSRSHVYLVEQHSDNGKPNKQRYVLKAPSLHFSDDSEYLNGFIREQWVGQRVQHPSLMKVYPTQSAFLYHLCEFIEGQTLRQWMYDNPEPSLAQVRSVLAELIIGVRALQRLGILHRDLKPENIMITPQGKVVLIDYGAAQAQGLVELTGFLTSAAESGGQGGEPPLGALGYIAPEYLMTGVATHEADIFSMGVIVYEMLTAQLPYKHNKLIFQRRTSNGHYISALQYRPQLPLWLDLALKKACHPKKNQRYSSMSEFLTDISQPNKAILTRIAQAPLIEREPVMFWKGLSCLLFLLLILQTWYMV